MMWIKEFVDCLESSTRANLRLDEAITLKEFHLPKNVYKCRREGGYTRANLELIPFGCHRQTHTTIHTIVPLR